jgi:hypothetical protein
MKGCVHDICICTSVFYLRYNKHMKEKKSTELNCFKPQFVFLCSHAYRPKNKRTFIAPSCGLVLTSREEIHTVLYKYSIVQDTMI